MVALSVAMGIHGKRETKFRGPSDSRKMLTTAFKKDDQHIQREPKPLKWCPDCGSSRRKLKAEDA